MCVNVPLPFYELPTVSRGRSVARRGVLTPRSLNTIYRWVHRFLEEGVDGLLIRPGRGHKPAFSPSVRDEGTGDPGHAGHDSSAA